MNVTDLRERLEEDLAWRIDELRHLRNELLGSQETSEWPVSAMRAILVMQYAHLEGFAQIAFSYYVDAVNARSLQAHEIKSNLFASACTAEFEALRTGGSGDQEDDDGRLSRRAKKQVEFVEKLRSISQTVVSIDPEAAVSMEMNFGKDVLKRTLYRLGIPESEVSTGYFASLEFVRRTRNDIAHGSRKERIDPGVFNAHRAKCESFMGELIRLITAAIRQEWFRAT
ncbi:MAE_28990/MAE_18760 family HEPN-like nuclease [Lentzea sp. BCCO 10_0798]|uniref:MAE_28990/MAE_18760 family HEPN-like nuclease n=1 Tax=Lentzea kristufekii TaxID=3095430 RepID=A0ABU4U672_9PSEU|nr:MAE_28990/MAE_18760 family HEPN-like nuclease [Lentzea sp. BCCO 10_0798]MDX8056063.1 MAE_28990/MAE_18760 family HEPN-like nuclease [Lentzea sp. BCCO 10_0798]